MSDKQTPLSEKAFKKQTIPNSSLLSVKDVAEAVQRLKEELHFPMGTIFKFIDREMKKIDEIFGEFK